MLLQTIVVLMSLFSGAKMTATHIHVHTVSPFFLFEVDEHQHWKLQAMSPSILRFNPGDTVDVDFEVPPAISMIQLKRVMPNDVVIKEKREGKNPHGVPFKAVFLKGWETNAYLMGTGEQSIYLSDGVWEHPKFGLSGKKVLAQARDSFLFLNPANLSEGEIRKIILGSAFKKHIVDHEAQQKKIAPLMINDQADKYVVSLKGMRGGPVFHVSKKDLQVQHHMER